jgi:hypothetical protein
MSTFVTQSNESIQSIDNQSVHKYIYDLQAVLVHKGISASGGIL